MAIHLSEYSDTWVSDFMTVAGRLVEALDGHGGQGIEHIGATSVPGMVARPIIDIAVIAAPLAMDEASEALEKLGYVREGRQASAAPGEVAGDGRDLERTFLAPTDAALHSLTLFDEESPRLHAAIAVRQVLMTNEALAAEFSGYKRGLAFSGDIDVAAYKAAKNPMFAKVLKAAGMDDAAIQGLGF